MIHCQCHLADKNSSVAHWFIARRAVLFHVAGTDRHRKDSGQTAEEKYGKKGPLRWV